MEKSEDINGLAEIINAQRQQYISDNPLKKPEPEPVLIRDGPGMINPEWMCTGGAYPRAQLRGMGGPEKKIPKGYCRRCGTGYDDGKFCAECGFPLDPGAEWLDKGYCCQCGAECSGTYCPQCNSLFNPTLCSACGAYVGNRPFCPECGQPQKPAGRGE